MQINNSLSFSKFTSLSEDEVDNIDTLGVVMGDEIVVGTDTQLAGTRTSLEGTLNVKTGEPSSVT